MDKRKIVPSFWPFFKEHGYKKRGTSQFYKIENDIAFCFLFERPSIIVYPTYYIWPLYLPKDYVSIGYGNRLSENLHGASSYCLWDGVEAFAPWSEKVKECLDTTIFPFYESINSPEKLWQFINQEDFHPFPKYFMTQPQFVTELQMYTACYIGDMESARKYYDLLVAESSHYPYFFNESHSQWEEIINMSQDVREAFFRDTIQKNTEAFGLARNRGRLT